MNVRLWLSWKANVQFYTLWIIANIRIKQISWKISCLIKKKYNCNLSDMIYVLLKIEGSTQI